MPRSAHNPRFIEKLAKQLFTAASEQQAFIAALQAPPAEEQAIVWLKEPPPDFTCDKLPALEWQPAFVDRVRRGQGLGTSELHAAGFFYLMDLSSVFAAAATMAVDPGPELVLDMCSAPGGKAVFTWRALRPGLMLCNEAIGKRIPALISNLKRCAISPVLVTGHDPKHLAEAAAGTSDLVLVDAPCSGQSLVVKGQRAPGCFNPVVINTNANRQKRIIAASAVTVAPGGYLLYTTCTYSREENEGVVEWFLKRFPDFAVAAVSNLSAWQSPLADFPCYRLFPQSGGGAGGYTALLRNEAKSARGALSAESLAVRWKSGPA